MFPKGIAANKDNSTVIIFLILFVPKPKLILWDPHLGQDNFSSFCADNSSLALPISLSSMMICTPEPIIPL